MKFQTDSKQLGTYRTGSSRFNAIFMDSDSKQIGELIQFHNEIHIALEHVELIHPHGHIQVVTK